jgi:hypothetical protein
MTQLSPTALEAAAKATCESMHGNCNNAEYISDYYTQHATAAITAYLAQMEREGFVVVPGEITEAMRWATWIDQSKHVGANEQEARILAGRRMIDNPEQKAMDESAYRALLAAAQNGGE